MIEAAKAFLALLQAPPADEKARLAALCRTLDALVLAYHDVPDSHPADGDLEPPSTLGDDHFDLVANAFPDFGLYSVIAPTTDPDVSPTMADAQDDLIDIAGDMAETLWRSENLGFDDAAWYFRLMYRNHWGQHLHDLRRYLYARDQG
ncbi:DUF5063 domain-containing protein [Lacibacterium aquatile]|uniref:DUF5063 domain-containing protein n=1 Tax=Lacibacterium aquatile TaxID=1168082 RepID=A0ABW5DTC6_9PROT